VLAAAWLGSVPGAPQQRVAERDGASQTRGGSAQWQGARNLGVTLAHGEMLAAPAAPLRTSGSSSSAESPPEPRRRH